MTLPFEQDQWVTLIKLSGEGFTDYFINVYGKDKVNGGSKMLVHVSELYPLGNSDEFDIEYKLTVDYLFYNEVAKRIAKNRSLPTQIEFSLEIEVGIEDEDGKTSTEKEQVEETLTVHFVRYVPKILNILGWTNGEKFQRIWFTEGSLIQREKEAPKLNAINWSWIITNSDEAREEYIEFKDDTVNDLMALFDNASKRSVRSEIQKMINEGLTQLPTKENPKTNFGVYDEEIITKKSKRFPDGEEMPKFEKYYFNSKAFGGAFDLGKHYIRQGRKMDDFIAALATFNYHVLASGYLSYKEGGYFTSDYTEITITHLGFYVKDSFDFIDDDPNTSQPLGFWKIVDKETIDVKKDPDNKAEYYEITNKTYRDYRDDHKMGYNFHLYSTIFNMSTQITLKL